MNTKEKLKTLYMNVGSIMNKFHHFEILLTQIKPDIVIIAESWTCNKITNASICASNYEIVARTDRLNTRDGRGGGVVVYANCDIASEILDASPPENDKNYQLCQIKIKDVTIVGVYRSPGTTMDEDNQLVNYLKELPEQSVVIGDFNLPRINWTCQSETPMKFAPYQDLIMDKFWEQHTLQPTHRAGNKLDLVLTNDELLDGGVEVCPELKLTDTVDHYPILLNVNIRRSKPKTKEQIYDFKKADFNNFRLLLSSVNWLDVLSGLDVETMNQTIEEKITSAADLSIPKKSRRSRIDPMWMDRKLKREINKKKRAWKAVKEHDTEMNREKHRLVSRSVEKVVDYSKANFEKKLGESNADQQKLFYSYMKNAKKAKESIGPLLFDDDTYTQNDKDCASCLNSYFGSVFTKPETDRNKNDNKKLLIDGSGPRIDGESIQIVYFGPDEIKKTIRKLKSSSSPGPDGISSRLLKEGLDYLSLPLSILFNMSIQTGCVPSSWRVANVTPLFKGGKKCLPSNYRPISLTSQVCKLMERNISKALKQYLEKNNILIPNQYGFRAGKSCILNLLDCWHNITESIEESDPVDVVYFDFSKAFDKVPHAPLLRKLRTIGVSGKLHDWIKAWLSNREQQVVLNGEHSTRCAVTSSVPQGSVLGPVLFLIYINDLCEHLTCDSYLFADDTKIVQKVTNESEQSLLQANINTLHQWSSKWGMTFNVTKCAVLHFGTTNKRFVYNLGGQEMPSTYVQKDLGVLVDTNGRFQEQVSAVAKKGNRLVGMVKRRLHSRCPTLLGKIYKTYILPCLQYASEVWNPVYRVRIDHLEKVQRRFTRIGQFGHDYKSRMEIFTLKSLETQRIHKDLKMMHRMYSGKFGDMFARFFKNSHGKRTRGDLNRNLRLLGAKHNIRKHSFCSRQIHEWNKIPLETRNGSEENFGNYILKNINIPLLKTRK
jgi:hypothetical protein